MNYSIAEWDFNQECKIIKYRSSVGRVAVTLKESNHLTVLPPLYIFFLQLHLKIPNFFKYNHRVSYGIVTCCTVNIHVFHSLIFGIHVSEYKL